MNPAFHPIPAAILGLPEHGGIFPLAKRELCRASRATTKPKATLDRQSFYVPT